MMSKNFSTTATLLNTNWTLPSPLCAWSRVTIALSEKIGLGGKFNELTNKKQTKETFISGEDLLRPAVPNCRQYCEPGGGRRGPRLTFKLLYFSDSLNYSVKYSAAVRAQYFCCVIAGANYVEAGEAQQQHPQRSNGVIKCVRVTNLCTNVQSPLRGRGHWLGVP